MEKRSHLPSLQKDPSAPAMVTFLRQIHDRYGPFSISVGDSLNEGLMVLISNMLHGLRRSCVLSQKATEVGVPWAPIGPQWADPIECPVHLEKESIH